MDYTAILFVVVGVLYLGGMIWLVVYSLRTQRRMVKANERIADALEHLSRALEARGGSGSSS